MSNISALLNLGNSDYYDSLTRKKRDADDVTAAVKHPENDLQEQEIIRKVQETAEAQKTARKLYQIEQEIEKLSLNQAQLLMQMVSDKISQSTALYLGDVQMPGDRGILAPAYI